MNAMSDKRIILVTGASRGLGRMIALRFGKARERVVINCQVRAEEATAVGREIEAAGGEALVACADVRDTAAVDRMVDAVRDAWGPIDVLVNNAGVARDGLLLTMSEQSWDEVIGVNLTGAFHCMRAAAKVMAERGQGHIISVSSLIGLWGRAGQANYAASKAALIGLTRAAAKEFGPDNIQVNAVLPGYIRTSMSASASNRVYERAVEENVLKRTSDAGEVADFVYHLTLMRNVSGQVFNLDSRIV